MAALFLEHLNFTRTRTRMLELAPDSEDRHNWLRQACRCIRAYSNGYTMLRENATRLDETRIAAVWCSR